jgi:hypothetical protein
MYDLLQLIGWVGAVALLAGYALLTSGRLTATGATYLIMNLAGSAALGLSTAAAHAWPSTTVNVLWLAIGIGPLVRALALRQRAAREQTSGQRLDEVGEQVSDVLDTDREAHEVLAHL